MNIEAEAIRSLTDAELRDAKQQVLDDLAKSRRRRILEATAMTVYAAMKAEHPAKFGYNEQGLVDHVWECAELFVSRMPKEEP